MIRKPTPSESIDFPGTKHVVQCDKCGKVIDLFGGWYDALVKKGMYRSPCLCWRCKNARPHAEAVADSVQADVGTVNQKGGV